MSDIRKAIMDRLGAVAAGKKAAMGMVEQNLYQLLKSWYALAEEGNPAFEAAEAMRIAKRALSLPDYRPTGSTVSLHKMANELLDAIRTNYSRPGAKAKMDKSAALAIVGKAVSSVPAGPQRDALQKALIDYYDNTQASNRLLQQGKLTDATRFDVEAGRAVQIAIRVWDRMGKPAAELRGYTQNLERAAEFSRPGAKAKMARWEESHAEGWGDLSKTLTATINGTRWTIVVDASTGKGQLMRSTGRGPQVVKEGAVDQLKRYAETARASRPGAKATAAKPDDTEREDVKAGLKLMEKADQAVSDKIRTLIKEGKPQDQAVAIALDMKRRGEL